MLAAACFNGSAVAARPIPSLNPFSGSLGFAPERPRAVAPDHPLFGRITVEGVQGMPGRIGSFLMPVTSAAEFNDALRDTLAGANMLAASPGAARFRLRVSWRRFDLPFRISVSSRAQVAVHYELSRIDNGQVIFSREIATGAQARGGNAAERARGTGRAAVATNIASAALCLDKAAILPPQQQSCLLSPVGSFSAPIAVSVPVYRR